MRGIAICFLCALMMTSCSAQAQKTPAQIERAFNQKFSSQGMKAKEVYAAPFKGWYEVVVSNKDVIYIDESLRYMFIGDLIDVVQRKSLTESRLESFNVVDFSKIPLDQAVVEVRGNGSRKIVVFSDSDCPYCKQLELAFAQMTDISIYTILMPIASLHPQAVDHAVQIWCQPDRTAAWLAWMRENKAPQTVPECANPIARNVQLGESLGFMGTPTLVFPNGKVISGYLPLEVLEKTVAENQ